MHSFVSSKGNAKHSVTQIFLAKINASLTTVKKYECKEETGHWEGIKRKEEK